MSGRRESTDLYSRTAPDNVGCGSGFFRVLSPRTNERASLIEQENTQSDGKHSIHMIMRKKSPFRQTEDSFNRQMKSPSKEPTGIKTHHHLVLEELKKKVSGLEYHLAQINNQKHIVESEKLQLTDALHHIKALHEQQKRHLQSLRQSHEATIQQSNNLRLQNQMLKSKLQDRTAKLEECLTILKTKYNHFEKQQQQIDLKEQQRQELTANVKKLEAEVVRLKQQLIAVYDQNYHLKGSTRQTSATKIGSGTKMYPVLTQKEQLLVDWKYNLQTLYKVAIQLSQRQIDGLQQQLSQFKGKQCLKCEELRCLIISMNEGRADQDYGAMAEDMVKKASSDMFNKFCQAEQVAI